MGLWYWLRRWLFGIAPESAALDALAPPNRKARRQQPRLAPLRSKRPRPSPGAPPHVPQAPYRFARLRYCGQRWLDLTQDGDDERLREQGLPCFKTPQELADWLGIPLGRLAWLVHRFETYEIPPDERSAHYHFRWLNKRSGGKRLIEAPKRRLKAVQLRILREILDKVPPHAAAHGFVSERSIVTNAAPHAGQRVVLKLDLRNFYPSVRYGRVLAIFRSLGYCREAAVWLGRLVTSALPVGAQVLDEGRVHAGEDSARERAMRLQDLALYVSRHLPQGAPTSPALANLSAFSLDLRLSGLARTFDARYTRYADDLTFSGDERFLKSLAVFIPLAEKIIRSERFRTRGTKRQVLRNNQRQRVAGVVVNGRPNVCRADFDRLKAILTNCVRRGPSTQNHDHHENFPAHLRGRIAHVAMLNPARGAKLLDLYQRIDWNR